MGAQAVNSRRDVTDNRVARRRAAMSVVVGEHNVDCRVAPLRVRQSWHQGRSGVTFSTRGVPLIAPGREARFASAPRIAPRVTVYARPCPVARSAVCCDRGATRCGVTLNRLATAASPFAIARAASIIRFVDGACIEVVGTADGPPFPAN